MDVVAFRKPPRKYDRERDYLSATVQFWVGPKLTDMEMFHFGVERKH